MQLKLFAISLLALGASAQTAAACDGRAEVEAAFLKQHEKPWRTRIASVSGSGQPQEQIYDYQPPDRLHRIVKVGEETAETIGAGKRAWGSQGGGWKELEGAYARVVYTHMQATFAPPRATAEFNCLGEVEYHGATYRGYQTQPEKMDNGMMVARTIYVDPKTGLPAYNIIGTVDDRETLHKEEHTYPTDIDITPPG